MRRRQQRHTEHDRHNQKGCPRGRPFPEHSVGPLEPEHHAQWPMTSPATEQGGDRDANKDRPDD